MRIAKDGTVTVPGTMTVGSLSTAIAGYGYGPLAAGATTVSGTLGVGSAGDVGTTGSVLTSNGPGAAASWTAPVALEQLLIQAELIIPEDHILYYLTILTTLLVKEVVLPRVVNIIQALGISPPL